MRKILLVLGITAALVLAGSAIALAIPIGDTIPHGGYASTTDACLQCHDIHQAAGEYALTRWATVTDTCGSCHTLYLTAPGGLLGYADRSPASAPGSYSTPGISPAYDPGYPGAEATPAAAAPYTAYAVPWADRYTHEGHRLGQLYNPTQPILFADGVLAGANYIPGGTETYTRIVSSMFWTTEPATEINPLVPYIVDPWVTGLSGTAGLYCASCHTPHGNFGYMLPNSVYEGGPGKLLSSRPNHRLLATISGSLTSTGTIEDWDPTDPYTINGDSLIQPNESGTYRTDVSSWNKEGNNWCSKCHDKRMFGSLNYQGNAHKNHPDTRWVGSTQAICLSCHGDAPGETDFPHTSSIANLLTDYPDLLCITCHTAGSLP